MKFPQEAKLSAEAKDLIRKLLCNVEQRLGTKGAHQIKVRIIDLFFPPFIIECKDDICFIIVSPTLEFIISGTPMVQRH